jgi:hypothetical protein
MMQMLNCIQNALFLVLSTRKSNMCDVDILPRLAGEVYGECKLHGTLAQGGLPPFEYNAAPQFSSVYW